MQGVEESDKGEVCLTGALRLCSPVPGDGAIARAVFRRRGRSEQWNDFDGRTQDEVVDYLANTEITDRDLGDTFGPQWLEVVGIIRQAASATDEQIDALVSARDAWDATCGAALGVALGAARIGTRSAAWDAARDAARGGTWSAAWIGARGAAWDAVLATITRDLIGTNDYTQEHHDQLMTPWNAVFGEVVS